MPWLLEKSHHCDTLPGDFQRRFTRTSALKRVQAQAERHGAHLQLFGNGLALAGRLGEGVAQEALHI